MSTKYIIITGGVVSGLGKGITAASIGALLESRGLSVMLTKLDPYINVDPGTISPFQHGEVFVTNDGTETDLDIGHYERFTKAELSSNNNFTTGQVYNTVIEKERKGEFLGTTIQVIPHITDEIKRRIYNASGSADVSIIEIGGTVGDIESLPFLEAVRQLRLEVGSSNIAFVHMVLLPSIADELKTKPAQHSTTKMREIGLQPDILLCRAEAPISKEMRDKLSLFTNVSADCVIPQRTVEMVYEVPLRLHEEGLDDRLVKRLGMWTAKPNLTKWRNINNVFKQSTTEVRINIVGKYVGQKDAYESIYEALQHGSIENRHRIRINPIKAEEITPSNVDHILGDGDAVLIPGGFGERGFEGKLLACQYAREHEVPYLGICLGFQVAIVEYARHVLNIANASSEEITPDNPNNLIIMLPDQNGYKGASMRLGGFEAQLKPNSLAAKIYRSETITERHRHRLEFNNDFEEAIQAKGMLISATSRLGGLVEMIEIPAHPWFIGSQFHPELVSKPFAPHPLFVAFIEAARKYSKLSSKAVSGVVQAS